MRAPALTETQRLYLLEKLETAITQVREELAARLIREADPELHALASRLMHEDRNVCDVVMPELDFVKYGHWITRANELERAIADFQMGDFGSCEQCSATISFSQLRSDPAVRDCHECDLLLRQTVMGQQRSAAANRMR